MTATASAGSAVSRSPTTETTGWEWLAPGQLYIRIRRMPDGMRKRMFFVWGPDALDAFDWGALGDGQYEWLVASRENVMTIAVTVAGGEPSFTPIAPPRLLNG